MEMAQGNSLCSYRFFFFFFSYTKSKNTKVQHVQLGVVGTSGKKEEVGK
jgi:hypothetical protein